GWHNGWILLHLFYHPKEGRQPSAYTRLETVKHASQDFNIPHAAYSGCAAGHQARRLVYNHRPKGGILHVPITPRQTVPVLLSRAGLTSSVCSHSGSCWHQGSSPDVWQRHCPPLQARGMRIFPYLDDWLIRSQSRGEALRESAFLISYATR